MFSYASFWGDISYPLYLVHYPFIYLYYAWVKHNNLTFGESLPGALALLVGSVVLAYLSLKLYDEPVRKYLSNSLTPFDFNNGIYQNPKHRISPKFVFELEDGVLPV